MPSVSENHQSIHAAIYGTVGPFSCAPRLFGWIVILIFFIFYLLILNFVPHLATTTQMTTPDSTGTFAETKCDSDAFDVAQSA